MNSTDERSKEEQLFQFDDVSSSQTMKKETWLFFDDRPMSENRHDRLWNAKGDEIRNQLESMAQRMTEALYSPDGSPSMTFAVLGGWGAGKSSFLRILRDELVQLAGDDQDRLCFCEYPASSFAHIGVGMENLRLTLGMEIMRALNSGNDGLDEERILATYGPLLPYGVPSTTKGEDARSIEVAQWFQELASQVTRLVSFPRYVASALQGTDQTAGQSRVLIIMIDDLDRCPVEFVEHVLRVSQEWADIENTFFVLAINKDWLSKAVATLGGLESETEYALEKYVQHSISLPEIEGDRLVHYVRDLLESYDDPISQTIVANTNYIQKGLRYKTPRAVKRLLNSIKPRLSSIMTEQERTTKPQQTAQILIKERVLEYSWPDFYRKCFARMMKSQSLRLRRAWERLEGACRFYEASPDGQEPDDERLEFSLNRIGRTYGDPEFRDYVLRTGLVSFLATEPFWVYEPPGERDGRLGSAGAGDFDDGIPPIDFDFEAKDSTADVESEFQRLYYLGRAEPRAEHQLDYYRQAAELARAHRGNMPSDAADEIGNMALAAEQHRAYDLAQALFRLALDFDNDHPNNMQNYVSFILDAKRQGFYEDAEACLEKLQRNHPKFKPERTFRFRAQLSMARGQQVELSEEDIDALVARVADAPDEFTTYGNAMLIASDVVQNYDLMRRLLEVGCAKGVTTSALEAYRRIRGFADQVSAHKEWEDKRLEALEIYRRLLEDSDRYLPTQDVNAVRHNYATLLFTRDIDDEAGRLWHQTYREAPHDRSIRAAYGNYLAMGGRPDLATDVLEGKPVEEMFLWPEKKPMPEAFSDKEYIDEFFELMDELTEPEGSLT